MIFTQRRILVPMALSAVVMSAVVGCSTIMNARMAQGEVDRREDKAANGEKLNLKGWELERLVGFALTNRPSMVAKRLALQDARLALKQLAADAPVISETPWTAPHLSVSGGYSESSSGTYFGETEGLSTSGTANFGLSLELLLYDFGRYDAKAKSQANAVIAAEQSLIDEGYAVFGEVSEAYFNLVEARSLLDVAFTNRADYADQLARVEVQREAGEAYELDVLRAKVDLANSETDLVSASNSVETCGAAMMYALGIDVSRGTSREVLDMSSVPLGTAYRAFAPTEYPVETAYELARTNAPEMRVARAKLKAASHDVDYAIANMMPEVTASVTFSWVDPMWYWTWGVNAVQSIFEGFRKTTAVDRAVVAMQSAATDVDECEQQLSSKLETAIAVRDNSVVSFRASMASVKSTLENMETIMAQFDVGDVSRLEMSAAVAQYTSALGDAIKAFYYEQKAEAALFAMMGVKPTYKSEKVKVKSEEFNLQAGGTR